MKTSHYADSGVCARMCLCVCVCHVTEVGCFCQPLPVPKTGQLSRGGDYSPAWLMVLADST